MTAQFKRVYRATIGTVQFSDLDIEFSVVKSLAQEPNSLDLIVYNLSPANRKMLQEAKGQYVQLEAGYEEAMGVIFLGKIREARSTYEAPDWITYIGSGDGEQELQTGRVNKSYAPGTTVAVVFDDLAKGLRLEVSYQTIFTDVALVEASNTFLNGLVLSGAARRELERLVTSAGMEWSVQDSRLQLLKAGTALAAEAVVLSPSSGLVGSPTMGSDGTVNVKALLNSSIIPGKQLKVDSASLGGFYRCEKVEFTGDTAGNDWYSIIEAKELK